MQLLQGGLATVVTGFSEQLLVGPSAISSIAEEATAEFIGSAHCNTLRRPAKAMCTSVKVVRGCEVAREHCCMANAMSQRTFSVKSVCKF